METDQTEANKNIKGIILAGGRATRLYPVTKRISKQLLVVCDKPMIYYPLSVLMLAGIREILIISTPVDLPLFRDLLGDGEQFGLSFDYAEQPRPEGLAQAFVIAEPFIANHPSCLILGDNIFYGRGLLDAITRSADIKTGAIIFAYWVKDPERFGVVAFDNHGKVADIVEKPKSHVSNWAVTGLYCYDDHVSQLAATLKPSARKEYEITDLNRMYLKKNLLKVEKLGRDITWLDAGTHESFAEATNFIQTIEDRDGLKVACLEEIAYRMEYIAREQFESLVFSMSDSRYRDYLLGILKERQG